MSSAEARLQVTNQSPFAPAECWRVPRGHPGDKNADQPLWFKSCAAQYIEGVPGEVHAILWLEACISRLAARTCNESQCGAEPDKPGRWGIRARCSGTGWTRHFQLRAQAADFTAHAVQSQTAGPCGRRTMHMQRCWRTRTCRMHAAPY